MDLIKSYEYFQPELHGDEWIHVIGCGSVGATVAENLRRLGLTKIVLWDFDTVCSHNIANQIFTFDQIGMLKSKALKEILLSINPERDDLIKEKTNGWDGERLYGYVFLCVDSIELRKRIVEVNKFNSNIIAMFDFRTGLTDAQHYGVDWFDSQAKENFLKTMDFTDEEAHAAAPVTACNTTLSVCPTVRIISSLGVANFMNVWNGKPIKHTVLLDAFDMTLDVY